MASKSVLAGSGYSDKSKGAGTKVAEYSEQGPFHCSDCVFVVRRDVPEKGQGLCGEPHVSKDPQIETARRSKLKVISLEHGCCRYVKYKAGFVEDSK